jgi:hypothetical protein
LMRPLQIKQRSSLPTCVTDTFRFYSAPAVVCASQSPPLPLLFSEENQPLTHLWVLLIDEQEKKITRCSLMHQPRVEWGTSTVNPELTELCQHTPCATSAIPPPQPWATPGGRSEPHIGKRERNTQMCTSPELNGDLPLVNPPWQARRGVCTLCARGASILCFNRDEARHSLNTRNPDHTAYTPGESNKGLPNIC